MQDKTISEDIKRTVIASIYTSKANLGNVIDYSLLVNNPMTKGWFKNFIKNIVKVVVFAVIVAPITAVCAAAGSSLGPYGLAGGGVAGFIGGAVAASTVLKQIDRW